MFGSQEIIKLLEKAFNKRLTVPETTDAYRLFNGFYEGVPGLVIDRFGTALVIVDHAEPERFSLVTEGIVRWAFENLDGLEAILLKQRHNSDDQVKQGILLVGHHLPDKIMEFGGYYALDLQMHQDSSFYLDTRYLRRWLSENMSGMRVLNTFAYTGSLGVAAGLGGASQVVQTDLNQKFLRVAEQSWQLNNLPQAICQIIPGDFFRVTGRMRVEKRLFDCVIVDPPYFSTTTAGKVDMQGETTRLVNKVRPLVAHDGWLVLINNALFLPGADYMAELNALCLDGYLSIQERVPVPKDVTGYADTIVTSPPTDPAPFNHPTKIAILKVTRKDKRV